MPPTTRSRKRSPDESGLTDSPRADRAARRQDRRDRLMLEQETDEVQGGVVGHVDDGGPATEALLQHPRLPIELVQRIVRNVNDHGTLHSLMATSRAFNELAKPLAYNSLPLSRDTMRRLARSLWPVGDVKAANERPLDSSAGGDQPAATTDSTTTQSSRTEAPIVDEPSQQCKLRAMVTEITLVDLPSVEALRDWEVRQAKVMKALHFEVDEDAWPQPPPLPSKSELFPNLRRVNITAQLLYEWTRVDIWAEQTSYMRLGHLYSDHNSEDYDYHLTQLFNGLRGSKVEVCIEHDVGDYRDSLKSWLKDQSYPPDRPDLDVHSARGLDRVQRKLLPSVKPSMLSRAWEDWDYFGSISHRNCNDWSLVDLNNLPSWGHRYPAVHSVRFRFDKRFGAPQPAPEAWNNPEMWDQLHHHLSIIQHKRETGKDGWEAGRARHGDQFVRRLQKGFDEKVERLTNSFIFLAPPPAVQERLKEGRFESVRWMLDVRQA